ncbi:AimR family lysis-lysogeny pheromone receptor, partial [Bacillus sp. JJ1127]|uniref:AimR family lysis-lysogeny pheromone receptor n=1 Tax=Bacillus sp. JJ1127 TaxID=3122952 RepID=UPI002FFED335
MLDTIMFLKIHHEIDLKKIKPCNAAENAYLQIKLGNKKTAIAILEDLQKENGFLSSYQLYYLGLAKNDKNILIKSLESFEKEGNIFYARLPKIQLGIFR